MNAAARGHMPFAGHRTQKQVREDEERETLITKMERELRKAQRESDADKAERFG